MNFGHALDALKSGKWVQRRGWNGKNMHLYLEDGGKHKLRSGAFKGELRQYDPCICMFTVQGTHQYGWLASQADMLAGDWQLVVQD